MKTPYGYVDHDRDRICAFCGEPIPQVEKESQCAELCNDDKSYICYACQNGRGGEHKQDNDLRYFPPNA
jgi:hypothetical protein